MVTMGFDAKKFLGDLKTIAKAKAAIMPTVYQAFVNITPIRSGNAKSSTTLDSNHDIQANYPYAGVLDKGRHMTASGMRGSKQAPQGMTKPTTVIMNREISKFIANNTKGTGAK